MDESQALNPNDKADQTGSENWFKRNFIKFRHLIRSRWQEYLMDIIVVIIGITISFALNNQKEQISRRELEKIYLKSLLTDIESDIKVLEIVINETQEVIDKANKLISIAESGEFSQLDTLEFLDDIRVIISRPSFVSKDATFSDMKSSGNIQLINDVKLKNLLFEYYRFYEIVKMNELAEREATITITGPYLFERFPMKPTLAFTKQIRNLNIESIVNEVEFGNNLILRLGNRQELLHNYKIALKLGLELNDDLENRTK